MSNPDYGNTLEDSSSKLDQNGLSSKTLPTSKRLDLKKLSTTSWRSITWGKHTFSVLAPLVEYQDGKGFISLPTVTAFDCLTRPLPSRKRNKSGGQKPGLVSVVNGPVNPNLAEYILDIPKDLTKLNDKKESECVAIP